MNAAPGKGRLGFAVYAVQMGLASGIIAVAGCTDRITAPSESAFRPQEAAFTITGDDTPLSVTVTGEEYVFQAGSYQYTATVSGGSGSYRYKWLTKWCNFGYNNQVECASQYTLQPDSSAILTYSILGDDIRNDIVVEVQDASLTGRSGVGKIMVFGPNDWPEPDVGGSPFACDLGSGESKYPLLYWSQDASGNSVWTSYRRNPCSGAKEVY